MILYKSYERSRNKSRTYRPKAEPGWGLLKDLNLRERLAQITDGKIQAGGGRSKPLIADYTWFIKASS
jgi:hypothetical protein